jgi:hypothetical protein
MSDQPVRSGRDATQRRDLRQQQWSRQMPECALHLTACIAPRLFQTVESRHSGSERLRQFDYLEVADPSTATFDTRDGKSVDIPALALTAGGKLRLGQTRLVP